VNRLVLVLITAVVAGGFLVQTTSSAPQTPVSGSANAPAGTPPSSPSQVSLADASPIVLVVRTNGDLDERVSVLVKNEETSDRNGYLTVFLADSGVPGENTWVTADSGLSPRLLTPGITSLSLRLLGKRIPDAHVLSGFVVLRIDTAKGSKASTLYRPLRIVTRHVPPDAQDKTILYGFLAAIITVVISTKHFYSGSQYVKELHATWTANDSWATNFTVLGALVGTLMSVATPAVTLHTMTRAEYAALAALLALIVALAPAVFKFLGGVVADGWGSRLSFIISSVFTLTAAYGQTYLLFVLLNDIRGGGGIGSFAYWLTLALLSVLGVTLLLFAIASLLRATKPDTILETRVDGANLQRESARKTTVPTVQHLL